MPSVAGMRGKIALWSQCCQPLFYLQYNLTKKGCNAMYLLENGNFPRIRHQFCSILQYCILQCTTSTVPAFFYRTVRHFFCIDFLYKNIFLALFSLSGPKSKEPCRQNFENYQKLKRQNSTAYGYFFDRTRTRTAVPKKPRISVLYGRRPYRTVRSCTSTVIVWVRLIIIHCLTCLK